MYTAEQIVARRAVKALTLEALTDMAVIGRVGSVLRSPLEEARALEGIGRCAPDVHRGDEVQSHLMQAEFIYRTLGVPVADRVVATLIDLQGSRAVRDA